MRLNFLILYMVQAYEMQCLRERDFHIMDMMHKMDMNQVNHCFLVFCCVFFSSSEFDSIRMQPWKKQIRPDKNQSSLVTHRVTSDPYPLFSRSRYQDWARIFALYWLYVNYFAIDSIFSYHISGYFYLNKLSLLLKHKNLYICIFIINNIEFGKCLGRTVVE